MSPPCLPSHASEAVSSPDRLHAILKDTTISFGCVFATSSHQSASEGYFGSSFPHRDPAVFPGLETHVESGDFPHAAARCIYVIHSVMQHSVINCAILSIILYDLCISVIHSHNPKLFLVVMSKERATWN